MVKQANSMVRQRWDATRRVTGFDLGTASVQSHRTGKNVVRAAFALALVLLSCARIAAQQDAPSDVVRHVTINWAKVDGATGYRVLVRPLGGDVTLDRRTTATSMIVVLPPGTYQVRVVSFNLFGQAASVSSWHNIDVVRVYVPVVSFVSPTVLYAGLDNVHETIDGRRYLPETTVALTRGGRVVAAGTIDALRDDQIQVRFDLKEVPPGKYDLRLANPENLVLVVPNAVEVRPRIQPGLEATSIHSGYNDRTYRAVAIRGSGFVEGTGFFLERDDERIELPNVRIKSSKQASADFDLGSATPGRYDLVAANPGGKSTRLKGALEVLNITTPVFESMTPNAFTIGESAGDFTLRAKELIPDTQVFLREGRRLYPTVSLGPPTSSPGEAAAPASGSSAGGNATEVRQFSLDLTSTPPGRYDLVIANSQLLQTIVSGAVTVRPKPIPRLTASSITHAYDTLAYPGIVLEGVNLKSSYGIELKRGDVARNLESRFISPSRMSVDIDFRGMAPGTYSVLVESSGRVVASLPGGIVVTTPHQRFVHPTKPMVMLGYPYGLVLSRSFANSVSISTIGGRLIADFPLGGRFFPKIPGLRDLGIGLTAQFSLYDDAATGAVSGATSTIDMTRPGMELVYRTPFNFPLNGFLSAGYGMTVSGFQSKSKDATVSGSSLDFYYDLGAGAELDLGKRVVLEGGLDWVRVLYAVTNLDVIELYLRGGIRLGR